MKIKDISNKTAADLNKMVAEKREALRVFRFGASGSKTKNVKQGREIRKDIARILTVLNTTKKS
jgi:ribosomal protein L29